MYVCVCVLKKDAYVCIFTNLGLVQWSGWGEKAGWKIVLYQSTK